MVLFVKLVARGLPYGYFSVCNKRHGKSGRNVDRSMCEGEGAP